MASEHGAGGAAGPACVAAAAAPHAGYASIAGALELAEALPAQAKVHGAYPSGHNYQIHVCTAAKAIQLLPEP